MDPERISNPETRYARSGDLHIAYQVVGDGPVDLVATPGGSHTRIGPTGDLEAGAGA